MKIRALITSRYYWKGKWYIIKDQILGSRVTPFWLTFLSPLVVYPFLWIRQTIWLQAIWLENEISSFLDGDAIKERFKEINGIPSVNHMTCPLRMRNALHKHLHHFLLIYPVEGTTDNFGHESIWEPLDHAILFWVALHSVDFPLANLNI